MGYGVKWRMPKKGFTEKSIKRSCPGANWSSSGGKEGKDTLCIRRQSQETSLFGKLQNAQNSWNIVCKRRSDSCQESNALKAILRNLDLILEMIWTMERYFNRSVTSSDLLLRKVTLLIMWKIEYMALEGNRKLDDCSRPGKGWVVHETVYKNSLMLEAGVSYHYEVGKTELRL